MLRHAGESQTVNNHIYGGVGGTGGGGGIHGGAGGAGEGPTMNYDFDGIENFTMNNLYRDFQIHNSKLYTVSGDVSLVIQNHRPDDSCLRLLADRNLEAAAGWPDSEGSHRELSGPTRNLHHGMQAKLVPYDISSRPRPSVTGFDAENPSSSPHGSFSRQSIVAPDPLPHIAVQSIHGGTFIKGNVNNIQHQGGYGLQFLYRVAASDAFHNSAERFPQPKCHPKTRTKMLGHLWNWAHGIEHPWNIQDNRDSRILWLHGPAGAGKSAIAQSLCQKLEAEGRLAASFFFKRGHASRGNATRLFATIAYQLAILLPEFASVISQNVAKDPAIVDKSLSVQLEKLIIEPCRLANPASPPIIIIDGLDECEGHSMQQEILRSIGNTPRPAWLPIRLLLVSRPEPHITEVFREACLNRAHNLLNIEESFSDVRKYLRDEFARIHRDHNTMAKVARPWPSGESVDRLVRHSSGYFIYAATVMKFVDNKNCHPEERLGIIMGLAEPDYERPWSALDQLYTQILEDARPRPSLRPILCAIVAKWALSMLQIEQLLGLKDGEVHLALRGLHSVLKVPALELVHSAVTAHHASFLDFLNDSTRSKTFHSGDMQRHAVACGAVRALSHTFDVPPVNRSYLDRTHVAWRKLKTVLEAITMAQPSANLVSLLRCVNPDFIFHGNSGIGVEWEEPAKMILDWLNKSLPLPDEIIQLWEDYRFMLICDATWWGCLRRHYDMPLQDINQVLTQTSPQLIQVLHAYTLFDCRSDFISLFSLRLPLGYSWDDLRTIICPLRSIMGEDGIKLRKLLVSVSHPSRVRELHAQSTLRDLVKAGMQVMKRGSVAELPITFCLNLRPSTWSCLLRSCPPSPDLLRTLRETYHGTMLETDERDMVDVDAAKHNVVQWLKTFPEPPLDLIAHFPSHLWSEPDIPDDQHYVKRSTERVWNEWCQRTKWCGVAVSALSSH